MFFNSHNLRLLFVFDPPPLPPYISAVAPSLRRIELIIERGQRMSVQSVVREAYTAGLPGFPYHFFTSTTGR